MNPVGTGGRTIVVRRRPGRSPAGADDAVRFHTLCPKCPTRGCSTAS